MGKLCRIVYLLLLLLSLSYSAGVVAARGLKWLDPKNRLVEHWRPGYEAWAACVLLTSFLVLLACYAGKMRSGIGTLLSLTSVWLGYLVWFTWFFEDSPFRVSEIVGVVLDQEAFDHYSRNHHLKSAAVFALLAAVIVLPLIFPSWYPKRRSTNSPIVRDIADRRNT